MTEHMLKYYWGVIIQGLLESKCNLCLGETLEEECPQCHGSGRMPFKVDVDNIHYAIPLFALDKKGLHEFLKNISDQYPKKPHNGKPYSMSPNNSEPPEISKILNFFEEIELLATYSGIYLPIWEDKRDKNG